MKQQTVILRRYLIMTYGVFMLTLCILLAIYPIFDKLVDKNSEKITKASVKIYDWFDSKFRA